MVIGGAGLRRTESRRRSLRYSSARALAATKRRTEFKRTSNIERSTLNIEVLWELHSFASMFDVGRSVFDVRISSRQNKKSRDINEEPDLSPTNPALH
jgi:hypothetical protein